MFLKLILENIPNETEILHRFPAKNVRRSKQARGESSRDVKNTVMHEIARSTTGEGSRLKKTKVRVCCCCCYFCYLCCGCCAYFAIVFFGGLISPMSHFLKINPRGRNSETHFLKTLTKIFVSDSECHRVCVV